ncbi:MFS transporter [Limosilactobacillus antri]|uniref:MFS family major facilitator transporter, multidrug cation symporter n=1 Tax=Limosilactobacillus antri DSM 16041 TaxID=525309 RepID=C8P7Z9_9LACO|nr:MFS transporter [Limosilactobacillus antri]EEW53508.1 transporter, major facilitator family protein [Limosilactobacillus antri DSM 16041]KRK60632.1 MFS family major facilitator transporter, multidrug cation symporter [Limosilactobacillus antri DSM 16041]
MTQATTISPQTRRLITAILLLSAFVSLASQTMMVTALPVIEHELHVSLNAVQWLTTGYTLIIGIVTPLSSNLYDKFTNRQVFLWTIGAFIIGTVIGCLATNFYSLLSARLIQAAASGMLMSFQMTTMISIYPIEKRGAILGLSSLVISTAPALGPTLAGFILQVLPWRWLFIIVLPFMVLVFIIGYFKLQNFSTPRKIKVDYLSVFISLVGSGLALGSLTVFEISPVAGWLMLGSGLIIIALFVCRQLHLANPMLKVQIFKYSSFRLMTLVGIFAFMILLGTEQLIPIFTENVLKMGSFASGLVLLPGAICNGLAASYIGRLYDQYGPKWLIITGGLLMIAASYPLVTISAHSSIMVLTLAYAVRMIGNAFVFSPALSEAFSALSQAENSHGTALNNTLRQVAGAVSVTMLVVISGIPQQLVMGIRLAMWITVILIFLMLITFGHYLSISKRS